MFSLKHYLMLLLCSLLCFSCTMLRPSPPSPAPENLPVAQAVDPLFPTTSGQFGTEAQLKEARDRANAEANARRERLQNEQLANGINPDSGTTDVIQPIPREPIKRVSKYRTARAIVTKPGYVFNPWTNKAVDVR
ncbi:hypothetical protein N8485_06090, partial [Akkermansiaceae bacterium]|nr:hypothetical protein [Akkermansiaceae bacterium]